MTVSLDWSELAGKDLAELSTLLEILAYRAIETPEKEAVIFEGQSLSFERLWNELNRVASFLIRLGIVEGIVLF
jgi:acyl-CoA synthetase (AMP-forming)/AMP-acid ligase II